MDNILIIPILLPLVVAIASLVFCRTLPQIRAVSTTGSVLNLLVALYLMMQVSRGAEYVLFLGKWAAPFGIAIVCDELSAMMLLAASFVSLCVVLFAQHGLDDRRERRFFHPLSQLLFMGVAMSFLAGDLFNMFVSFEVTLIASYALLSLAAPRRRMKAIYFYLVLNVMAGMFFLFAAGLAYGLLGTLNLADMAHIVRQLSPEERRPLLALVALLLLVFGSKAAMFPLFFWLPHSYGTAATPVTALFAGMLTKVGVYAMIRVLSGVFEPVFAQMQEAVLLLAALTMLLGVIGAVAQTTIRNILSFHIISQIGYMIMGAALLTSASTAAAAFFIIHNMIVKTGLILVGGIVEMRRGTDDLYRLGDLWNRMPILGVTFFVFALSLAGLPPSTGFWGKWMVIEAGLLVNANFIVSVAVVTSVLTTFSMLKIWNYVFWRPLPKTYRGEVKKSPELGAFHRLERPQRQQWIAVFLLLAVAVGIGFFPARAISAANRAGETLYDVDGNYEKIIGPARDALKGAEFTISHPEFE